MKNIFTIICAILIVFFLEASFAGGLNPESVVKTADLVIGRNDLAQASVSIVDLPQNSPYANAFMWGGDETTSPRKIIQSIHVLRSGKPIFIPLSTYGDLGNPSAVQLKKLPSKDFQLIINGGDAAGSYSAVLNFKGGEISSRTVTSGEFPKEVWEKTVFSFNHLKN